MASSMMMSPMTGMMGTAGMGMSPTGMPMPAAPGTMNCTMVPRCTMKLEKCAGGMKINCVCDDKMAASVVQNLCMAMAGGMCSVCCTMNGMMVCCCNLTMGTCKCEMTDSGVCVTCTSGDKSCCEMIQACCDAICCMMKSGCTCCLMMNGMACCCC